LIHFTYSFNTNRLMGKRKAPYRLKFNKKKGTEYKGSRVEYSHLTS
jgi:hypothetical protein